MLPHDQSFGGVNGPFPSALAAGVLSAAACGAVAHCTEPLAYSLGAAFCVAAPVAFGWGVGDVPAGLVASIGAFTALYGADRPYNNRALVLAAAAVGLACAVGLGEHAALLVFAGGGFSTVVRVAGVLTDTRRPERIAVASAGTAVARFLKSVGGPDEDAARHSAAVTLHDT